MKKTIDILVGILLATAVVIFFYAMMVIGKAWEDQQRCENGATEFCQEVYHG